MGTPLDASAAAAAAAPVPAVATIIATATLPAAKAAATVATGAARTCSTSSSSSSPAHVPAAALQQATTRPASSTAPGALPPAAAGAPPVGAAAEAAPGAAVASEAAPTAAAAAEAAAALLTALPLCEKFSSSSSSSSCSGSHEPVSAAVGRHPADERPRVQPYIFGCTYTTGSSAPPVFSSATPSPSPQARPACLSAAAAVADASYHASVPENLSASSSSPLPAASSSPPATAATSASLSSSCSSSASTCSAAAAAGPACAVDAVLHASAPVPTDALVAGGINFEKEVNLDNMLESFLSSGFQATQLGRAIVEVRRMLRWRLSDEAVTEAEKGTEWEGMEKRRQTRCFIWLSFTSNMISSGLREVFLFLCKHRLVDVLITSAGGIEEDFVKVLAPTIIGDFSLRGDELRRRGWNRIGNLLVPNENYCLFEDWLQPILDRMLQEQHEKLRGVFARMRIQHLQACNLRKQEEQARRKHMQQKLEMKRRTAEDERRQQQTKNDAPEQKDGRRDPEEKKRNKEEKREAISGEEKREKEEEEISRKATPGAEEKEAEEEEEEEVDYMGAVSDAVWTPSEVIRRLGKEINDERSVYYWCWKNEIPVFCPGLTDGSLGDNLFFHSYRKKGLVIDLVKDVRAVNDLALQCKKSGMIILGGGLPKHHTCNANLMRNGADFAVYINTGVEYDGSDSGAKPDEAVSWGKITAEAKPVKVYGDATVLFPLLVAATFAKEFHANRQKDAAENGHGHEKLGKSQEEEKEKVKAPRRTG